ncbi:MAG: DUF3079 domain-containing protein [Gammaproteobacteria bacterium]|nr:DUF3079 domain-containing protein [Gammaproteobacteria bacterium]
MARKIPINPAHPERICWGCEKYCARDDMACGNGTERTPHPVEIFGEGWTEWALDAGHATAQPPSPGRQRSQGSQDPAGAARPPQPKAR